MAIHSRKELCSGILGRVLVDSLAFQNFIDCVHGVKASASVRDFFFLQWGFGDRTWESRIAGSAISLPITLEAIRCKMIMTVYSVQVPLNPAQDY